MLFQPGNCKWKIILSFTASQQLKLYKFLMYKKETNEVSQNNCLILSADEELMKNTGIIVESLIFKCLLCP